MNELAADLKARGLIEHVSADAEKILGTKRSVYLGVDPSADSMHAGNLLGVLLMKRLSDAGHSIQLLVGGGTGMIGDPKEKGERPLADVRTIARNKRAIKAQFQQVLGRRIKVVDNADWLLKVKLIDFLRDIGKHFTVNELIKRDAIKRRLDAKDDSISYTEFAYSLLQGYDYLVLNQKYGTDLQIGASDQWTNILSGVELIRRKLGKEAFALTTPLVTDSSGKKFGKSEGNAVWLDRKKTSPRDFYQFWLSQPDALVEKYLKFYTFLSLTEIEMVMELHGKNPEKREAQQALAREVTKLVHGEDVLNDVVRESALIYGKERDLHELKKVVTATEVPSSEPAKIVDVLVANGLVQTKNEARRAVEGNGVTIDGTRVTDIHATTSSLSAGDHELKFGNRSSIISIVEK